MSAALHLTSGALAPLSIWACSSLCSRSQLASLCKCPHLSHKNAFGSLVNRICWKQARGDGGMHGREEAGGKQRAQPLCCALPCDREGSLSYKVYQDITGLMQAWAHWVFVWAVDLIQVSLHFHRCRLL